MSYTPGKVLIVMPAKDEADVIAGVIEEVKNSVPEATVLVVDDGSTDQTFELALRSGVPVLKLPYNLGVGGAMRAGFKYAHANGYDVMVQVDSDGQHNPNDVMRLISSLDKADVVIGARFAGVGEYVVKGPRAWAMKLLSGVLSAVVATKLTDTTSGFKAHGPRAIDLYRTKFPAEYLGDTVEALVLGHRAGLKFEQVGVSMRERAGGTPSQNAAKSTVYLARVFLALLVALIQPSGAKE